VSVHVLCVCVRECVYMCVSECVLVKILHDEEAKSIT
jgi:hypothetical protein